MSLAHIAAMSSNCHAGGKASHMLHQYCDAGGRAGSLTRLHQQVPLLHPFQMQFREGGQGVFVSWCHSRTELFTKSPAP